MRMIPIRSHATESPLPGEIHALVVDDDDVDRERLARMLRRYRLPIHIAEAATKSGALSELRERKVRFSFIFLDFKLDDGDGRELLPDIWESVGADCVVVAVTGGGNEKTAADAIKLGIHEYLSKLDLSADKVSSAIDEGLHWIQVQGRLRQAEQDLLHRSLHDPLTDLPNRHVFFDRLEQLCMIHRRKADPFAVLMLDLDRFKEVNDQRGHAVGDRLLVEVAHRLEDSGREADTVARLGGDEFAMILHGVHSIDVAQALGLKVVSLLEQPFALLDGVLRIGASVGIALCPQHGQDPNTLLSRADNAMYRAKKGIEKVIIYDALEPRSSSFTDRMALLGDLELALDRGELQWHWQPKIDLRDGRILGFEALARWKHRQLGPIAPDIFIAAVEPSPLLPRFTMQTFERVLSQLARLSERMPPAGTGEDEDIAHVAINLSARMLEHPAFVEQLMTVLRGQRLSPGQLTLELTETALIGNPVQARRVIDALAAEGIALSIDDFGAGFTSFGYLREFAIQEIKIDKSYITTLGQNQFDLSLVTSLVVFCRALGIRLVAEGVENADCWQRLLALGCHCGQGYGIARPMPFEDLQAWVSHWRQRH